MVENDCGYCVDDRNNETELCIKDPCKKHHRTLKLLNHLHSPWMISDLDSLPLSAMSDNFILNLILEGNQEASSGLQKWQLYNLCIFLFTFCLTKNIKEIERITHVK